MVAKIVQRIKYSSINHLKAFRRKIIALRPASRRHSVTISLVAATYNVEPYIEEFLASVIGQSGGLAGVEVIIVDDGSTDRTGEIAQAWTSRYPEVLRYIRQQNMGAAEARNTGMAHATGDWISYPDPDDILPSNWLAAVRGEIARRHKRPLLMIAMPMHVFRNDDLSTLADNHQLRSLYRKRVELNSEDLGNFIKLSVATAFFDRRALSESRLTFSPQVRPTFEDGHLLCRLLLHCGGRSVVFLPSPAYLYRKRTAKTSQLDGAKQDPRWFTDQLRFGYLQLLAQAKNARRGIPRFLQRSILYSLGWRISYLIDHPERAAFLTREQLDEFQSLVAEIFQYIDPEIIRSMNLGSMNIEERKTALLGLYKGEARANDLVYVTGYDAKRSQLQFSVYTAADTPNAAAAISVDDVVVRQVMPSRRVASFLEHPFFTEHRFWVSASSGTELKASIAGRQARIKCKGMTFYGRASFDEVVNSLSPRAQNLTNLPKEALRVRAYSTSQYARTRFANCWVLMDREDYADDNAEHLYRHLLREGKADNCWFVLRHGSADWTRLEQEGFHLLPFGSDDHIAALVNSKILALSHGANLALWPVPKEWIADLAQYHYADLRHGILKDDLSLTLNAKPIALFLAAGEREWQSIASPESNYLLSEREVKLTGHPRHDALLAKERTNDTVLIMPTWRRYLVGGYIPSAGMDRYQIQDFYDSAYARCWRELLVNAEFRDMVRAGGKRIVFCPHPNMATYQSDFDLPEYIEYRDPRLPPSLQDAFAEAALLITDYSSVAFDCAYIEKPVVYYQFDRDEMFAGGHTYRPGYFDYRKDGFGPVAETLDEVLRAVDDGLQGLSDEVYRKRAFEFFRWRDGRCCERTAAAIESL